MLHEGNAVPLDGACDDRRRALSAAGSSAERALDGGRIVTVDLVDVDVKAPQLVGERIEVRDLAGRSETLQAVEVDEDGQTAQPLVRREGERFPGRALVPLAVRH